MTTLPFFANGSGVSLWKQEYGFYWEKADPITKSEEWSTDERAKAAKAGQAMSDGSFPIKNSGDLKHAIEDWARAGSKPTVKDHIVARAKALDLSASLPADWTTPNAADDKPAQVATA